MLRTEAYTVTEGLMISLIGTCSGKRHDATRCETQVASRLITTAQIERYGITYAVPVTISALLAEREDLQDLVIC